MAVATRPRHLFTTGDYEAMYHAGLFGPEDRVELINGEVVEMTPIGPRHAVCVKRLNETFTGQASIDSKVSVQDPIRIPPGSEPQPDLALIRPPLEKYLEAHPGPEDILLLVEVSDTTLDFDRDVKALLYSGAGVPETWVVDLDGGCVLVMTDPGPDGYATTATMRPGDTLSPRLLPGIAVNVAVVLGAS